MVRVLCIGDPHGKLPRNLPKADLILLTGDLGESDLARKLAFGKAKETFASRRRAILETHRTGVRLVSRLAKLAPVWLIFGNVEATNRQLRAEERELGELPKVYDALKGMENVRILNNRLGSFEGVRIGGLRFFVDSKWVRTFRPDDKEGLAAARKAEERARRTLSWFAERPLDILLCHQPPYGTLDLVDFDGAPKAWQGKHAGSPAIRDFVREHSPSYVVCGHIHEGAGEAKIGKSRVINLGNGGQRLLEF